MRQGPAFRFVPELLDDAERVLSLSRNPMQLYIESGLETMNMMTNLFQAILTHRNTKETEATLAAVSEKYRELYDLRADFFSCEKNAEAEELYARVKLDVENQNYKRQEVRRFISLLKKRLSKTIEILEHLQSDPDCPNISAVEELYRRALRDYSRLVNNYIEEEK